MADDIGSLPWSTMDPTSPMGALTIDQVLGTDPGSDPASANLAALVATNDARNAARSNVDPVTALQSKITGTLGQGAMIPLAIAGLGAAVLVFSPSGRRRR